MLVGSMLAQTRLGPLAWVNPAALLDNSKICLPSDIYASIVLRLAAGAILRLMEFLGYMKSSSLSGTPPDKRQPRSPIILSLRLDAATSFDTRLPPAPLYLYLHLHVHFSRESLSAVSLLACGSTPNDRFQAQRQGILSLHQHRSRSQFPTTDRGKYSLA